jgi:outer membrane protein TolC
MKPLMAGLLFIILSHSGTARAAETLTLEAYLKSVEAQSPDLKIETALRDESLARAPGVRLNPPMIGVMSMKDGSGNNLGLEVSQEIPFPSKLLQEKELRRLESEAKGAGFQYRKTEIMLSARAAYFDFWKTFAKLEIIREKRDWLKAHSKISRSATRSDSAAQVHLMGIESEVDLLENEVLEAETALVERRSALKTFAPGQEERDFIPVEPPLENIDARQVQKSAFVDWKEREVKASEASQDFSSKVSLPDLYVRYRGYNGNEISPRSEELMLGITLPFLYFWQTKAASGEAAAKSRRAQAELEKAQVEAESRISSQMKKLAALKKQLVTLNDKLLPRAHTRMRLVENLSQRTMEGLDEHRTVMLDSIELQLKALEVRSEYELAALEILKLTTAEVRP